MTEMERGRLLAMTGFLDDQIEGRLFWKPGFISQTHDLFYAAT
jgi:hypothetical protein